MFLRNDSTPALASKLHFPKLSHCALFVSSIRGRAPTPSARASDGESLRLDSRDVGALQPGDRIVLTRDGKLTVNGTDRAPKPSTLM